MPQLEAEIVGGPRDGEVHVYQSHDGVPLESFEFIKRKKPCTFPPKGRVVYDELEIICCRLVGRKGGNRYLYRWA